MYIPDQYDYVSDRKLILYMKAWLSFTSTLDNSFWYNCTCLDYPSYIVAGFGNIAVIYLFIFGVVVPFI